MSLAKDFLGIGIESTYGETLSRPDTDLPIRQIRPEITEGYLVLEDSLLSRKGADLQKSTSRAVVGDVSVYGHPDSLGYWLYLALGGKSSALASGETEVYEHIFTQSDLLPSANFFVRETPTFTRQLEGMKILSMSLGLNDGILGLAMDFIGESYSEYTEDGYSGTKVLYETGDETTLSGTLAGGAGGIAIQQSGNIRLTAAITNRHGEYYFQSQLGDYFDVEYEFYTGGGNGADASWFFWGASAPVTSEEISSEGATKGGYTVTADEYGSDEFEIQFNGASLINNTSTGINIDDGTWRTMKISVRGTTISVFVNGTLVNRYTDIERTLGGNYWGWGARTGGLTNEHRIRNMRVFKVQNLSLDPFVQPNFKVYLGTSIENAIANGEIKFDEWELKYSNNLQTMPHIGTRTIQNLKPTLATTDGVLRRYTDSQTYENYVRNNTELAMVFELTGATIGGTQYSLQIQLPRVVVTDIIRPYEFGNLVMEEMRYKALRDSTLGYSIRAVLINLVPSY